MVHDLNDKNEKSGADYQCQIEREIMCVQHGTPRQLYREYGLRLALLLWADWG
jgi:hypothetical protein